MTTSFSCRHSLTKKMQVPQMTNYHPNWRGRRFFDYYPPPHGGVVVAVGLASLFTYMIYLRRTFAYIL